MRTRAVWGGVAVALVATVLAVAVPAPASAVEPTAIVPTGVAAPARALRCPTGDVCWSAGTQEGIDGLVGVVQRIADGAPEAPLLIPVAAGETATPTGIDCWSAADCAVIVEVTSAEDPGGHPAVAYVLGGVPSAPEEIVVPGGDDPVFAAIVACHGPVCEVAGYDETPPAFAWYGYVATVAPGLPAIVDDLPGTLISDIECVGDVCGVVGQRGAVFSPDGFIGLRGPGGLVSTQNVDVIIDGVECEAVMSCVYTTIPMPLGGLAVGRITPTGGVQPPTPVPGVASALDLSCRGTSIDACVAIGFDLQHLTTVLVEDGVPGEVSVIEELLVGTAVGCGSTSCVGIGYTQVTEAGLAPDDARLLTGLALPPGPVATQLVVDPALADLRPLKPKLSFGKVSARLTAEDGTPLEGKTIAFRASGQAVCTAVTDADGRATCNTGFRGVLLLLLGGGVSASFAGDADALPSQGSAGLLA